MVVKKRSIVIIAMVLVLVAIAYLNYRLAGSNPNDGTTVNAGLDDTEETPAADKTVSDDTDNTTDDGVVMVSDVTTANDTYFRDFRFERESTRTKEIDQIKSVVGSAKEGSKDLADAQKKLLEVTNTMEKELAVEQLIKAKGFKDAVLLINGTSYNVIIAKKDLSKEEVAIITEIVKRETGSEINYIKITPRG